jgi:spore germination cell wall hydrolase CwlJ-like protein
MAFAFTKTFIVSTTLFCIGAFYFLQRPSVDVKIDSDIASLSEPHRVRFYKATPGYQMTNKDIDCLAKNIYYEAALEPVVGKYAVAHVTLNRLRTGHWGNTICDVVYAPHQFSWTLDAAKRNSRPGHGSLKGPNWDASVEVARDFADGRRVDGFQHALFYHADYVRPVWRHPDHKVDVVGRHIFYNQARGTQFDLTK